MDMERKIESLWWVGDFVSITFPGNGLIKRARVTKVSFTNGYDPLYDVEVPHRMSDTTVYSRLHGLKEWHLRNPDPAYFEKDNLPIAPSVGVDPSLKWLQDNLTHDLYKRYVDQVLYPSNQEENGKGSPWKNAFKTPPTIGKSVCGRRRIEDEEDAYLYDSLINEDGKVFIGDTDLMYTIDSPVLANWEWLDE